MISRNQTIDISPQKSLYTFSCFAKHAICLCWNEMFVPQEACIEIISTRCGTYMIHPLIQPNPLLKSQFYPQITSSSYIHHLNFFQWATLSKWKWNNYEIKNIYIVIKQNKYNNNRTNNETYLNKRLKRK